MITSLTQLAQSYPWHRFENVKTKEDLERVCSEVREALIPMCEGSPKEALEQEREGKYFYQGVLSAHPEIITDLSDDEREQLISAGETFNQGVEENNFSLMMVGLREIVDKMLTLGLFQKVDETLA